MSDQLFKKYRARIAREGILKSLLLAAAIGGGVLAVTMLVSWFVGFRAGLWLGIALFAATVAAAAPLLYFYRFRPTTKAIAKRVDELGLEERVLTMVELENDESYIAMKQREDTHRALGTVNHMLLKIAVSASLIVAVAVCGSLGLGLTAVQSLYYAGAIGSGLDLLRGSKTLGEFTVSYAAQGTDRGWIVYWTDDWDNEQIVEGAFTVTEGESAPAVLAVPAANWVFAGWSDGHTSPYRQDTKVESDLVVTALFERLEETVEEDEEPPTPAGNQQGDGDGQGNGPQPGQIQDNDMRDAASNQIVDGQTFYGDPFKDAYERAMERLASDENLPDALKSRISDYFNSIAQDGGGKDEEGGSD